MKTLRRFNLNLLVALDAMLNARNLTEAAKASHLSQPAMSVALKKLRAYFKDELVVYAHGTCELTALGVLLNPRIKGLLQSARESLELQVQFDHTTSQQSVTIVSSDLIELLFVSRVMAKIASHAPLMTVSSLQAAIETVEELFTRPADIAIISEAFASSRFASAPLFSDTLSCLVWDQNSEVGDSLSENQYYSMRHAATNRVPNLIRHPVARALGKLRENTTIVLRTSVISALPQAIIGTNLIATTLTRFAQHSAATLPLRVLPLPIHVPELRFVAQWQHYRSSEPLIAWTLSKIQEIALTY